MSGRSGTAEHSAAAFLRPRALDRPAVRLVVCHHAGGSAAAYFPLARYLPDDWDVLLLDLPGRGRRHSRPPLESVPELAAQAAVDILPWTGGAPLALFGHSLGAIVAHEAARALEDGGADLLWVGVSGRCAPGSRAGHGLPDHDLPDRELLARLAVMGGMHPRLDELPDFRARFLQVVRTDLRAVAGYRPPARPSPLTAPLTAFAASDDAWAPPESMAGWSAATRGTFRRRTFPGGHFHFLGTAFRGFAEAVAEEIRLALAAHPGPPAARGAARTIRPLPLEDRGP